MEQQYEVLDVNDQEVVHTGTKQEILDLLWSKYIAGYNGLEINLIKDSEQSIYEQNKQLASQIRSEMLKALKGFTYGSIYTEMRKGGKCRTKFWLVSEWNMKRATRWLKKHYGDNPNIGIEKINQTYHPSTSLVINVK